MASQDEGSKLILTKIWKCKSPDCKAWVRDEFASEEQKCPMCKGDMLRTMKHLPALVKKIKSKSR